MAAPQTSDATLDGRYTQTKLSSGRVHPYLIYGSGFKEDRTETLTGLALANGFQGIDSANYLAAYKEDQVGNALQKAIKAGVKREDILVQTKFTPAWAHTKEQLPYDADQPLEAQVRESVEQSFKNLQVDFIDALLLHVPFENEADNLVAWRVFESYVPDRVGVLGVSNFPLPALEKLYDAAVVKPEIVQNRFHEKNGYDIPLRAFLARKGGIVYQAFFLLKVNTEVRASDVVARLAARFEIQKELAFYLLVLGLGNVSIVNGTKSEAHMQTDLSKIDELLGNPDTVDEIKSYLGEFEALLRKVAGGV